MRSAVISKVLFGIVILSLSSCGDKSTSDPVNEDSKNVKVGQVQTTSFTVTVSGTIKGLSKVDIVLGKYGILYCVKSENAESILKSWKEGNDNAECLMYTNKNALDGESFSGTVGGLYPGTEYSFCMFTQNRDNSVREISDIHTFKTLGFSPSIKGIYLKDIHCIDATAELEFGMDALDAECCEYGVMLSESSGVEASTASLIERYTERYDSKINQNISGIMPDKSYYCRPYVKYETSQGNYDYLYGPESAFSTMTSDQMYVDLGLPSGIKWAGFSLFESEFGSCYYGAPWLYWGSSKPMYAYLGERGVEEITEVTYEYLDSNGKYIDLGDEISGTEYDAVHKLYGGKWRMPRKDDLDELVANCSLSPINSFNRVRSYYVNDKETTFLETISYFEVQETNGNSIRFRNFDSTWSGTKNPEDNWVYYLWCRSINSNQPHIEVTTTPVESRLHIRPVWDPNMPD